MLAEIINRKVNDNLNGKVKKCYTPLPYFKFYALFKWQLA